MFRVFGKCSRKILTNSLRTYSNYVSKFANNDVMWRSSFRVTVLGNGGRETSKSLLIIPEQATPFLSMKPERFIINCGETALEKWYFTGAGGFVAKRHKFHILTTSNTAENTEGISVFSASVMRLDDISAVTVYSPPGLVNSFKTRPEIMKAMLKGYIQFTSSVKIECPMFNVDNIVLKKNEGGENSSTSDVYCYTFEMPRNGNVKGPQNVEETDAVLVIDCPNEDYLDCLLNHPGFLKYQEDDSYRTCMVAHMSSSGILSSPQYQAFIRRFGNETRHLLLHEKCPTNVNQVMANCNKVLHNFSKDIFPLLQETQITEIDLSRKVLNAVDYMECLYYHTTNNFTLRINEELKKYDFADDLLNSIPNLDDKLRHIEVVSKEANVDPEAYPQIVFLGTGGATPCYTRGHSCTLVKVDADTSFLMDCGCGSYEKMVHLFRDGVTLELAKIKMIFVSHLHLDHTLGLSLMLKKCHEAKKSLQLKSKPVYLLSYKRLPWFYLRSIPGLYDLSTTYIPVDFHRPETFTPVKRALGLRKLNVDEVVHCPGACGMSVSHTSGWSLAYTGDAYELSHTFIKNAKNCDVLIHEASYEDRNENKRNCNMHSCQKNAIRNGKQVQAGFTVLNHITYAKHPLEILPELSSYFTDKNFMVQDFTKINLTQLPVLRLYQDLIYEAFGNLKSHHVTDKEKELERYSKASRSKRMFDY